jgi:hypothetical protein
MRDGGARAMGARGEGSAALASAARVLAPGAGGLACGVGGAGIGAGSVASAGNGRANHSFAHRAHCMIRPSPIMLSGTL